MDSQIASYSLLYAEDDQWLAEPIIASLQKDGYEVIYAHDGFDALAKYRRLHPDIILLDIRMPGLDGYEVAKEIRKEDPGVPILFLTVLSVVTVFVFLCGNAYNTECSTVRTRRHR